MTENEPADGVIQAKGGNRVDKNLCRYGKNDSPPAGLSKDALGAAGGIGRLRRKKAEIRNFE